MTPTGPGRSHVSENILVRGVNWLGDAVMTTPALIRLREARPSARITLLTPAKLADLWRGQPMVDDVLTFEPGDGPIAIGRRLRWAGFTTALVLPNSPRSALETFVARIPRRVGYARPWRNCFLTERIAPRPEEVRMHKRSPAEVRRLVRSSDRPLAPQLPPRAHHLYQYLHLAGALGASQEAVEPFLAVAPAAVAAVRRRFSPDGETASRPLIGLNPGAEYGPAKRWPADRFIAAAAQFRRTRSCDIWILGGPADRELADSIANGIQAVNDGSSGTIQGLAGKTSLGELCAALKACDVLLTNDTGPMHVAAAVGTPVVVPFGSTSPTLTGPGLPGSPRHRFLISRVPCTPCFLRECPIDFRCMLSLPVSAVVDALQECLRTGRAEGR